MQKCTLPAFAKGMYNWTQTRMRAQTRVEYFPYFNKPRNKDNSTDAITKIISNFYLISVKRLTANKKMLCDKLYANLLQRNIGYRVS